MQLWTKVVAVEDTYTEEYYRRNLTKFKNGQKFLTKFCFSDWRDLSVEQEKYLVQIRPPGDVITGAIRTLVMNQNISSAAVIYDETFGRLSPFVCFKSLD